MVVTHSYNYTAIQCIATGSGGGGGGREGGGGGGKRERIVT